MISSSADIDIDIYDEFIPTPAPWQLKPPLVMNYEVDKGPISYLRAFAIPVHISEMEAFVHRLFTKKRLNRMSMPTKMCYFTEMAMDYLPNNIYRLCRVCIPMPDSTLWEPWAIIFATNFHMCDMGLAENKDLIKEVQSIVRIKTNLAWYLMIGNDP
ncbi:hypothetical protein FA15DRAFT_600160 [Coprinopsis marcescibilis]|uniref:Uncharacterized protein n=1 Tax=Coprinopsis marcescibilis TaxID=230819 RepID=A0A5C3KW91_COPMA|nr:hypothetical protein FA15DRAFT_600160 [Coprinopsis marcescibilis]